jgi:uncharacterized protein (DUF2237 family)
VIFGKRSQNIKITSNVSHTAIPATSFAPTGFCLNGRLDKNRKRSCAVTTDFLGLIRDHNLQDSTVMFP